MIHLHVIRRDEAGGSGAAKGQNAPVGGSGVPGLHL